MKRGTVLVVALLALAAGHPAPAQALMGDEPAIRSIVPGEGAAGFGQLVTIQGFNLFDPNLPHLTEVTFTNGATTTKAFVFEAPSTRNEVYVRIPALPADVTYQVRVRTLDDNLVSAPFGFRVKSTPGVPVPRRIVDPGNGFAPITTAKRGQIIGVQAYGTDTAGATAEFKPIGFAAVSDTAMQTFSSGTIGLVSQFTVPTGLPNGPLLVQLRVRVNGVDSDLSLALRLTIID